jgi:hypothetical protein
VQTSKPDWAPLLAVVGDVMAESFMWMSEIRLADGCRFHAYKHLVTRRYLNLARTGRAFEEVGETAYREVAVPVAVTRALSR